MKRLSFHLPVALAASLLFAPAPMRAKDSSLDLARQLNEAFVTVSEKASASVVVIRVAQKPGRMPAAMDENNPFYDYFRRFFEQEQEQQPRRQPQRERKPQFNGQGSGFIVREDGYIVTNNHVIEDAEKVRVKLQDGREVDAVVQGTDPQSDIAVLKIDLKGLPALKFADSDKTRVGEYAIAIGAPFGLDYSVTIGHVNAKGRSNIVPSFAGGNIMDQDFIQTDASINPGNSGGPLVNINGEVIGVNTMIRGMNTGIGFAVPADLVREVSDKIIAEGKFVRAWIGVSVSALSDFLEERPEFGEFAKGVKSGVVVAMLVPDGPAAKSDLKPSDIITSVEGRQIANAIDLRNAVRAKPIGKELTLDVVRNGQKLKIKVNSAPWPDEDVLVSNRGPRTLPDGANGLGFAVKPLTEELAAQLDLKAGSGLVVSSVDRGSAAEAVGIKPGDVITEINRKPVSNLREFRESAKAADLKKGVLINFISGGAAKFEVLKDAGR